MELRTPREHVHRWHIAYKLPMALPDAAGWMAVLFGWACPGCHVVALLHGNEHIPERRLRLHGWEIWVGGRCVRQGKMPSGWRLLQGVPR